MRPMLPTMTSLRVFDAAARHLTCSGAADELCLTQSAVSKQLRMLEDGLGVALFVRTQRGLALTEVGRIYLEEVRPLLSQLASVSARLSSHKPASCTLTLRIQAVVGDRFLLPRVAAFQQAHPHIQLQFTNLMSHDPGHQVKVDAELRAGEAPFPGYAADYLFGREKMMVAAPALLEAHGGLNRLEDLSRYTLLEHFEAPDYWPALCRSQGRAAVVPDKVLRFEFVSTVLSAAARGMGVAIVPAVWAQDEIARGELINPMGFVLPNSRRGYYLLVPEERRMDSGVAQLREWVVQEAAVVQADLVNRHPAVSPAPRGLVDVPGGPSG